MATKKPIEHPNAKVGVSAKEKPKRRTKTNVTTDSAEPDRNLTDDQKSRLTVLLPEAQKALRDVEDRITALAIAATARWVPAQNRHDTDEHSAPAFGDDEYADFLALVETVSEAAWFQAVSDFMGIPSDVTNKVMLDNLSAKIAGTRPLVKSGNGGAGVVVHRRHGIPRGEK